MTRDPVSVLRAFRACVMAAASSEDVRKYDEAIAQVEALVRAGSQLQFTRQNGQFVSVDTAALAKFVVSLAPFQDPTP